MLTAADVAEAPQSCSLAASLQQALLLLTLSPTTLRAACRAGEGLGLAAAMGFSNVLESLTVNQYFYMLFRIQLHLKVGITWSRMKLPPSWSTEHVFAPEACRHLADGSCAVPSLPGSFT